MIFFTENPVIFNEGDFYTVQNMAGLPSLPAGKIAIGQGYRLVASPGAPVISGSISFQYLGNDALTEGVDEEDLALHFWDGSAWQVVATSVSTYFNLASGPSQGPGVYALLAGKTIPAIQNVTPPSATNDVTTTLVISGGYFLAPLRVRLVGPTATYTLPVQSIAPHAVSAVVTRGLRAGDYRVEVVSLNQPGGAIVSPTPGAFALFDAANACFYDFFESGSSQWELGGAWDIVAFPGGGYAITDSPGGNYDSATAPAITRTTAITSVPFSLNGCSMPLLAFRHDYILASVGPSRDVGRVQISTDGGATWETLTGYTGGGFFGNQVWQPRETGAGDEWSNPNWRTAEIGLSDYSGTVQLRFVLEVDRDISDRGWLIDDVMVVAGTQKQADLQIGLTRSGGDAVVGGEKVNYTLAITNAGPHALDAQVTGIFPAAAVASARTSAACWAADGLRCYFDELTGTRTITLTLFTTITYSGTLTTTAEITPLYPYALDSTLGNNHIVDRSVRITPPAGFIYLPLVVK